ncbi:DUF11 domain-containing protein [Methanobacterium congolense]|uniref:Repeat-containing protein n=1 Tax=Methanobacterium congolense TaxID=118062 RepID=A0A1D3KZL2_9EURY|nr:DUF11 domain-containing protein [Methanobacterium congolense]SCG84723.1 Repeat-containing protein [Methanobacterium congolense]
MKLKKFSIALLGLILLLSLIGSASAAGLTAELDPRTAQVGDTVTLTVTANNDGLYDWYPVIIRVTHSSGLEFQSFIVPDKTLQNYDESTGIWNVNRMRHEERGLLKTLVITYKVMPSAAGKTLTASARFKTLQIEATGDDITNNYPAARTDSLTVSSSNGNTGHGNGTGNGTGTGNGSGTGNGNGTGSGNGNGNGNGNSLIDASGNSKLASAIGNMTSSNKNSPLKNLQGGGGGGSGKAYEVTTTPQKTNPDYLYILVALLLIGLILAGYFYGVRRE